MVANPDWWLPWAFLPKGTRLLTILARGVFFLHPKRKGKYFMIDPGPFRGVVPPYFL